MSSHSLPLVKALVTIVKILREQGPVSSEKLLEMGCGKRRTVYRVLETLEKAELARPNENGKYVWYEYADALVFKSEAELKLCLDHSKNLIPALRGLCAAYRVKDMTDADHTSTTYAKYAQMHLRTGYPELHDIYVKAEEIKKQIQEKEKEFFDGVKERLRSLPRVPDPDKVAKAILNDMKSVMTGHDPDLLLNLDVRDSLKGFVKEEELSANNRKFSGQILEYDNDYYRLRSSLEEGVGRMILQVENGEPMRGRCDLCPRVRINVY